MKLQFFYYTVLYIMNGKQIHHHHSLNITGVSSTVYGQKQEIYNTGAHHNIICIANNGGDDIRIRIILH